MLSELQSTSDGRTPVNAVKGEKRHKSKIKKQFASLRNKVFLPNDKHYKRQRSQKF